MEQKIRIEKIEEIIKQDKDKSFGMQEIPWKDDLVSMQVYKIPLSYLVYNKYNGRILSRTKSLEKQNHSIDVETKDGRQKIEQLLWDSKEDRNKKTQLDISNFGQKKVGIITRDGIIIDGNRRAMLLNKLGKVDYFKTVILPVTLEENPIEIKKLETTFQMGEDEKLGYNPIEKYLKAKDLYEELFSLDGSEDEAISKISDWMGEQKPAIQEYLLVMKTMDEYLNELKYDGIYTQLDGREDQFINLTKWLNNFYEEESGKAFDGYTNLDVNDLKILSYDYIRDKYEGKEFRVIAHGQKQNHFFGDKEIWESFCNSHFELVKDLQEPDIDIDSQNLKSHLDDRDANFSAQVHEKIKENLESHYENLRNKQAGDKPEKLIKRSIESLDAIQQGHESFSEANVQKLLEDLAEKALLGLQRNSPVRILAQVKKLLEQIDLTKIGEENAGEARQCAKNIQHILNNIRKEID
jgi:hypothetical protein